MMASRLAMLTSFTLPCGAQVMYVNIVCASFNLEED